MTGGSSRMSVVGIVYSYVAKSIRSESRIKNKVTYDVRFLWQ